MQQKPDRKRDAEKLKPKFDIRLLGSALAAYAAFNTVGIASDMINQSSDNAQFSRLGNEQTSLVQAIEADKEAIAKLDKQVLAGKTPLAKSLAQGEALDLQSKVNRQQIEAKNLTPLIESLKLKVQQHPDNIKWKSILALASAALSIGVFTVKQKADFTAATKALRDSELNPEQRKYVDGLERMMDE
jgi:type VI protein secretion system component VasA